jgi:hypothetical protein
MIPRRVKEALSVSAFLIGSLGAYFGHPEPVYGPLVGASIGCCAISIGIQQAYAYSAQASLGPARAVYLWSSATLIFLGLGTVAGCLPNMTQLHLTAITQHKFFAFSIGSFVLGFGFLFRLAAAYFYRRTQHILTGFRFRLFRSPSDPPPNGATENPQYTRAIENPWYTCAIEILYVAILFFCILAAVYAAWGGGAETITGPIPATATCPCPIPADDPVYFPVILPVKLILGVGLFFIAFATLWFFLAKFKRVKAGEPPDGVEFILVMGVLYFVPFLIQVTALLASTMGWILSAWHVVAIWLAVTGLIASFVGFTFSPDNYAPPLPKEIANTRRVKVAMLISLVVCSAFSFLLLVDLDLLKIIPFTFITLAFLTLACAYLPIHDLELQQSGAAPTPEVTALLAPEEAQA